MAKEQKIVIKNSIPASQRSHLWDYISVLGVSWQKKSYSRSPNSKPIINTGTTHFNSLSALSSTDFSGFLNVQDVFVLSVISFNKFLSFFWLSNMFYPRCLCQWRWRSLCVRPCADVLVHAQASACWVGPSGCVCNIGVHRSLNNKGHLQGTNVSAGSESCRPKIDLSTNQVSSSEDKWGLFVKMLPYYKLLWRSWAWCQT